MEATGAIQIRGIKLKSQNHRGRQASIPGPTGSKVMTKVCEGIRSKVGFSKDMDKLNNLELGSKPLNIFDNHLEAPRDGTFVKNIVDNEFRVTLHLNFEKILS